MWLMLKKNVLIVFMFLLQNFDTQLLSINVGEALQVMDYSWDTAFIGSRSGKIYIFDTKVGSRFNFSKIIFFLHSRN